MKLMPFMHTYSLFCCKQIALVVSVNQMQLHSRFCLSGRVNRLENNCAAQPCIPALELVMLQLTGHAGQ